jgi:hypothetical protein
MAAHRVFFAAITVAVWVGHRRALRAGGFTLGRFWRTAWAKMRRAWREMDPAAYSWPAAAEGHVPHGEAETVGPTTADETEN